MNNIPYVNKALVTAGDLGFVTAGTALYTVINQKDFRGTKIYNVAPGQLVAWVDRQDGTIPLTETPATIVAGDLPFLHIGVGHDGDGDGITESVRQFGPDHAEACTITGFNAVAPQCGLSEIKAIYPSCLSCDTLTIRVTVNDSFTRSFASAGWPNEAATFVASYTPDCATCGDCDKTVSCDEYMCGLVDELNGEQTYKINGEYYPDYFNDTIKRPFRAVKLHPYWYSYCIVPAGTTCKDCFKIDDLTTFTVGDGGDAVVNFVGLKTLQTTHRLLLLSWITLHSR